WIGGRDSSARSRGRLPSRPPVLRKILPQFLQSMSAALERRFRGPKAGAGQVETAARKAVVQASLLCEPSTTPPPKSRGQRRDHRRNREAVLRPSLELGEDELGDRLERVVDAVALRRHRLEVGYLARVEEVAQLFHRRGVGQ